MNVTILRICMYSWVQKVIILFNFYNFIILAYIQLFYFISFYFSFFLFHPKLSSIFTIRIKNPLSWKIGQFLFFVQRIQRIQKKKIRKNSQFAKAIIYKIPRHSFLNCEERLSRTAYWLNNGRRKPIYFLSSESSTMGKGGIRFLNWDALCFQGNYDTL